ncbi:MAG: hypothetical protein U0414_01860 [Polyangiaceae bacterium]
MKRSDEVAPRLCAGLGLLWMVAACGGPNASGVAVGRVGGELRPYGASVPQGGEVCLIEDALTAQPGQDKPMSDACKKALRNDRVFRKAFVALADYGEMLDSIAGGEVDAKQAGKLEAAESGVDGADFSGIDGAEATSTRDAMQSLVKLMSTNDAEGDLGKIIKAAAPHVKAICEGLSPYLDKQAKGFHSLQEELEKKRDAKTDRRCGNVDGKGFCVGESTTDKSVYAGMYSQLATLEDAHADAGDALDGFCAAHKKLEEAADAGTLKDEATYDAVVSAVKSAHGGGSSSAPAETPAK